MSSLVMQNTPLSSTVVVALSALYLFEPGSKAQSSRDELATSTLVATSKAVEPIRREEDGVLWRELIVPGSKVTLVHYRNHHLSSSQSPSSSSASTFWKVQEEMLSLLNQGHAKYQFKGLYADGVTDKYIEEYNKRLEVRRAALAKEKSSQIKEILATTSDAIQASGAIAAFAISHDMRFLAGESYELHRRAFKALQEKSSDADYLTLDAREDHLLNCILRDFPEGGVCVATNFGCDHRFFNNIAAWNEAHPEFQISCVEISPKLVREIVGELPRPKKSGI